jgi:ubiquinone/menaquinone biosynthesis C-methylase UbiE
MTYQDVDESNVSMEAPGHAWKNEALVAGFVEQTTAGAENRRVLFDFACDLFPFERDARIRVLDIGAGYGAFAAAVLERFPQATAVGLDFSEPMIAVGRERMARFGERFSYHIGDIAPGLLPRDLPAPYDAAVASASILHLPRELKRRMYGELFRVLNPGGCFFNVEWVAPANEEMQAWYQAHGERERQRLYSQAEPPQNAHELMLQHHFESDAHQRHHHLETEADQVAALRAAGFVHVDCFYKRLLQTLIGGYKPSARAANEYAPRREGANLPSAHRAA